MAKKELALLTLQSLVYLPILIFLTKGTVIVLAIVVICGLVYARSWPRFRPLTAWTFLLVTGALSAIWSITPGQSLERAVKFGLLLLLLGALMHVVSRWTDADRRYLVDMGLKAWWISLVVMLPILIFEAEVRSTVASMFSSKEMQHMVMARKPISNNAVIILVVTAFPLLGHAISGGWAKRYVFLSLAGLFVAVYLSGSTSALLGLSAGLAVWCLYARFDRVMAKALTIALPLAMLSMPVLIYPMANNPEPIARNIPNFPNSFIHRLLIWDFTLERISERPLLGWGLDTSRAIPGGTELRPIHFVVPWSDTPLMHPDQNLPLHPHNAVLQIWLELGLLGVIVAMIAVWNLLRTQLVSRTGGPMAGFIVCAMAIYCVAFGLMQSWWLALLFLTWAAVKAGQPSENHTKVDR
ncbi:MAG: O-antigen ligase family protein [Alphaproteobacteria bacterium]